MRGKVPVQLKMTGMDGIIFMQIPAFFRTHWPMFESETDSTLAEADRAVAGKKSRVGYLKKGKAIPAHRPRCLEVGFWSP